jgi:phytoene desaturase
MLYLGVNKKFDLKHHSIVFADDYQKNVQDIFGGQLTEKDFSVYLRDASAVDSTLAPAGKSALYVLVPVPNNRAGIDWSKKTPIIRHQVLEILEKKLGLTGLTEAIEVEKIITPDDWEKDFNVYLGAVFNLSHRLDQMLWFRPHNKFEELDNCYLVGGGTHPGSGLPTIYESGRIVAKLLCQEFKKEF